MYKFKFNLFKAIRALETEIESSSASSNEDFKNLEGIFKKNENEYTSQDKLFILNEISTILMGKPQHTLLLSSIFRPLLVDLVSRYIHSSKSRAASPKHQSSKNKKQQLTSSAINIPEIENITFIFSQLLPTTPQLQSLIIEFYEKSNNINQINNNSNGSILFESILNCKNISEENEERWLTLVQSCYRLLTFNRKIFSTLFNWSPLYSLLEIKSQRITWYVIKCMSMVLNVPDNQLESIKPLYKQYHHQIIQIENEILNLESSRLFLNQNYNTVYENNEDVIEIDQEKVNRNIFIEKEDLHHTIIDVCGILLFKKFEQPHQKHHNKLIEQKLVYTNTVSQNLNSLAIAVGLGKPILIEGVTGSGKTTMVEELSRVTGNDNIIRIHLGDQTDSKVLLGTYITSDTPGEFKWQAGALTQAVSEGRWILIEDIDLAPVEVLSVLIPLLENRTLFIPGRGEVIEASNGFQLFATQTLFGTHSRDQNANILSHLWTRVVIEALSPSEMKQVLSTLFPQLVALVPKFIETFNLLLRVISNQSIAVSPSDEASGAITTGSAANSDKFIIPSSRFISSRDLIKWIKRCNERLSFTGLSHQMVTSTMQEIVFVEALDCFCSMISKKNLRKTLTEVIGRVWELTADRINYYVELYKPSIQITEKIMTTGRASLECSKKSEAIQIQSKKHTRFATESDQAESGVTKHGVFAHTMNSLRLMEKISISIQFNEPILLVGETGTGKTSVVQYVADQLNQKLVVLNLNQQSDSSDLIGGFKPVEMRILCLPLKNRFDALFKKTFSEGNNSDFLDKIHQSFLSKNWKNFITLLNKAMKLVENKVLKEDTTEGTGKKRQLRSEFKDKWVKLAADIKKLSIQFEKSKNNFAFSFVEGSLINCIRKGYWVLLDEMNLATSETLESLSGLFEGGSLTLTEKGDVEPVERHPNFKVFACMNPPTDIGKKDLPPGIRNRFTEYYVDDLDNKADLCLVVKTVLQNVVPHPPIEDIVEFYLKTKQESQNKMLDGSNQKPHFSLRTLSRALNYTKHVTKSFGFQRALFEGISMSFLTQLNRQSYPMMEQLIKQYIKKGDNKLYSQPLNKPSNTEIEKYVQIEQFWIECGDEKPIVPPHYILTPSIKANLSNLSRVLVSRKHPILLQGPTSSGKTSMVEFLAQRTGHRFIRINNHEHTDLQEYLGQYISDDKGKLVFQEGILVEAVRKGYWVVLDELNLAPSEVLEALNRLLDDNRELFIPETQEVVKPHPHFMLFATQNPPGLYGGRKVLSRAFRNRFLELHVDDIPENELEEILCKRCALPPSYCKKLVAIMKELQLNRQGSTQVFAGKHGAITFRDLFRWAERKPSSYEELGYAGFMLLAERLRKDDEKAIIKQVIEKHLKIKIDMEEIYACDETPEFKQIMDILANDEQVCKQNHLDKIVWTRSMKRLFSLVGKCLEHKEPILLVGETGCSKTTICQIYSILNKQKLHILNCHQHTETADFIGGLRPVRGRDQVLGKLFSLVKKYFNDIAQLNLYQLDLSEYNATTIDTLPIKDIMESLFVTSWKSIQSNKSITDELRQFVTEIDKTYSTYCSLFNWVDGPLVEAMKSGDYFLIDEISLAEDAVLERLNSVLEPSRLLVLAEKGGVEIEELRGHQDFRILATMNPGGDFGKKELSPAMRNRFTEIWVPAISSHADLLQIIEERFTDSKLKGKGTLMLEFIEHLLTVQKNKRVISLRDILSWINFMNLCMKKELLTPNESYIHGACLVLLDGFGMGSNSSSESEGLKLREACLVRLISQISNDSNSNQDETLKFERELLNKGNGSETIQIIRDEKRFGIHPFYIPVNESNVPKIQFSLSAPTTSKNAQRVLRGMQLPRAILIEGSPGVGKTSLITAIANATGNTIVRINLSEQTDIMDLLGSDLPVEGGTGGQFEWRDGVFLEALRKGYWVLLDELNLASQTVLEGLNSCLDHRSEVYIPELGKTFQCHPSFRVFACQNPLHQGGGRKGLPKSFLNRFTQVFIDQLDKNDLLFISTAMYPLIPAETIKNMIDFNHLMFKESMIEHKFGRKGAPWEFNLRDTFRWCDLIVKDKSSVSNPGRFIDLIYLQRMRTQEDRLHVIELYKQVFGNNDCTYDQTYKYPHYTITPEYLQIGSSLLPRNQEHSASTNSDSSAIINSGSNIQLLHRLLNPLENIMKCIEMNWMSILIGPTSTSKTSSIRLLAQLTGNTLYEFSMNSSVDTTEILGGFEQIDMVRYQKKIISSTSALITKVSSHIMTYFNHENASELLPLCIASIQDIYQVWNIFVTRSKQHQQQEHSLGSNNNNALVDTELLELLNQIIVALEKVSLQFNMDSIEHLSSIQDIKSQLERLKTIEKESVTGCFEWIDGLLIKALETGAWILIDNVNFCNPTVLDRLNPLLEQDGVLMLNERGMVDGQVKVIKPHKNFRIFLTMDDRKGEISRAMRNRGIEIYMPEPHIVNFDNQTLLTSLGIPIASLTRQMIEFHNQIFTHFSSTIENPVTLSQLLYWGKLMLDQLQRGFPLESSIRNSMEQIYVRPRRHIAQKQLISTIYNTVFSSSVIQEILKSDLTVLGIYPKFIKGIDYVNDSTTTSLTKNSEFFEFYFNKLKQLVANSSDDQQEEKLQQIENYKVSAKFLIENLNSSMLENYISYLNNLKNKEQKDDPSNQILLSLVASMKQLFGHSVYKSFEEKLNQLLSSINLSIDSKQLLVYQGHQWKNNDSLFKLIKEKVDNYKPLVQDDQMDIDDNSASGSLKELFNSILFEMEIIKLLLNLFIQTSKQEKEYTKFLKSQASNLTSVKVIKQQPVILLSLAYTKKMLSRDHLPHQDVVSVIYRLFKSLDDQIDQWLNESSQQVSGGNDALIKGFNHLIELKNNFWNSLFSLPSSKFNLGEFIIRWRWIHKEINLLTKAFESIKVNTGLQVLIDKIETSFKSFHDNSNNRLWKVSGYPMVMKSDHLVQLDAQFLSLLDKVQFNFNKNENPLKHNSHYIDEEWRKTLLEAISTLYWANYQLNSSDEKELERVNDFINNLDKVPSSLSDKLLELINKQKDQLKSFNPVGTEIEMESDKSMEHFDPLSIKHQVVSISPLIDHNLHLKETFIIAQLSQLLLLQHMDIESGQMKPTIIPILESIIDELKYIVKSYKSSNLIPRSIYHLAFYQKLIWMIDNYLEKVNQQEQEEEEEATEPCSIGIIEIQSVIHSILYIYNQSQWNNSFNDISCVSRSSMPQYKYQLTKNEAATIKESSNHLYDSIRFGYGPPRLFQNIQSIFSYYLTCDWGYVSIAEIPTKIDQLNQIIQHLTNSDGSSRVSNIEAFEYQIKQSIALILSTVSSFYKSFDKQFKDQLLSNIIQLGDILLSNISVDNIDLTINQLIDSIKSLISNSTDQSFNTKSKKLLVPCFDLVKKIFSNSTEETSNTELQSIFGQLTLLLNTFRLIMYIPSNSIDPTQKYGVVLQHSKETSNHLENEIEIRKQIEKLHTGRDSNLIIEQLVEEKNQIDEKLTLQMKKITLRPIPSQFEELYRDISQFSDQFSNIEKILDLINKLQLSNVQKSQDVDMNTNGNEDDELNHQSNNNSSYNQMVLNTETMWQDKANHFIQSCEKKYYSRYRDIIVPIITSVYQMKSGLRLMSVSFKQKADDFKLGGNNQEVVKQIQKVLLSLSNFPRIKEISDIEEIKQNNFNNDLLLNKFTLDSIKEMMKLNQFTNEDSSNGGTQNFKVIGLLLRSSLCQIYSQLSTSNYLDVASLESIDNIFRTFVSEWKFQQEEKRKKDEAANQEFKYKVQSHKMETKEEKDEKVFLSSFPSFYKEFQDLEVANVVENQVDDETPAEEQATEDETSDMFFKSSINNEEVLQLCSIHRDIFKHLDGIPIPRDQQQWKLSEKDRSELFQLFYSSSHLLMKILNQRAGDMQFDEQALGSHILSAANLRESLSVRPPTLIVYSKLDNKFKFLNTSSYLYKREQGVEDANDVIFQNKTYNIYRDPNVAEISNTREPLLAYRERIFVILKDYPDQANLVLMVKLIDRLLTYPATDPLAKILTGLELLLRKSLEWESFASKAVSIQDHLNIISSMIVRWRKLEIESWPSIFQSQEKEAEVKALKSWFILYELINDEPEENHQENLQKNFKTLQEYLYCSNLGDFLTRIELLKAFYKQLNSTVKLMNGVDQVRVQYKQSMSDIIYNVYKYYENFIPRFEDRLAKEIKPIEEKAIEFIKLSRWEDNRLLTQYERLKHHIEVSHRNLAKITIKYKNVLASPLSDLFTQIETDIDIPSKVLYPNQLTVVTKKGSKKQPPQQNNNNIENFNDWFKLNSLSYLISDKSKQIESIQIQDNQLLNGLFEIDNQQLYKNKLPQLSERMIKICKQSLLESYSFKVIRDGVEIIDDLAGTIIERIGELAGDKIKRQEKELALKELLSRFEDMGLSFHSNSYSHEQLQIAYLFSVPHLPTSNDNTNYLPKSNTLITRDCGNKLIEQSDSYFYRIVSRVHRLRQVSLEYHSDVASKHVQRINGYIENFLSIILSQRKQLIESIEKWSNLISFTNLFLNQLNVLSTDDIKQEESSTKVQSNEIFNNQKSLSNWFEIQRESINQLNQGINEVLLLCIKTSKGIQGGGFISTIIPPIVSIQQLIESTKLRIDQYHSKLRNLYSILDNQYPMMSWSSLYFIKSIFNQFNEIKEKLLNLDLENLSYIKSPISILVNNIDVVLNKFSNDYDLLASNQVLDNNQDNENNIKEFNKQFENIVESLLISIQNLKKQSDTVVEQQEKEQEEEQDEDLEKVREYRMEDGSISKLNQFINGQMKSLQLGNLLNQFINLHKTIVNGSETTSKSTLSIYRQMLDQLKPILSQFMLIVNQNIVDLLSYHKTCCKLHYVVTGVFVQLYTKGFCKPQEEGETGDGEGGNGNFEDDVQGTGMGEGKGKEDVSDRIRDREEIEGLQGDEKEEKDEDEDEEKEEKDEDQGFDMEDDFEGDMHDIKKDPADEDKKKDEEEEEHDKELGELEKPEENVVDEKLWDDEEDVKEEEEGEEDGQGDTNTDEVMGKNDDKEEKKDDKKDNKDDKKKPDDKGREDENEEIGEEEGEEEEQKQGEEDEEFGGEEDEEGEEDPVNQEQEKEENHMDARGDDQMEIPDELEFEESGDEEQQAGEEEPPFPEESKQEEEGGQDSDGGESVDKEGESEDENEEEDENKEDKEEEDKENNIDQSNADSITPEEDGENAEDEEDKDQNSLTADQQQDDREKESEQPLGVKDKKGSKSNVSNNDDEMQDQANQEDNADDDSGMTQQAPSENDTGALKNLKAQPPPNSQQQQQQKPPKKQQVDPNPYRSMGDANKEWKKRLNLLDKNEEEEEPTTDEKAPKQDKNAPENKNQDYEFMKEDKENQDGEEEEAEQALAAATDSQLQDIKQKAQDENAEQEEELDDDQMDIDDDQDHKQQIEHQDDSKEEMDQNKKISMSKLKQDQLKEKEKEDKKEDKQDEENKDEDDPLGLNQKDKFTKEQLENITGIKDSNQSEEEEQEEDEEEETIESVEEKKLTREDLEKMRQDLEQFKMENNGNPEIGSELWKKYEQLTSDLSQDLCEQLRLILEPTLATKLQGDYKTGKRINMKKVIPYIASQFKKDKIWLRRTKPNKRQYQVLLAIDDTESMAIYHSGQFALEAMTMISRAMSRLEVGQLGIVRFGEDVQLVHSFDQVFSDQTGPEIITQFKFDQTKTNMTTFLSKTLQIMEMNKQGGSLEPTMQLVFIISDGWSLRDPETTKKILREASIKNLFIVFIVIDNPVNNNSILDFESISFNNGKIQRTNYMSEFPFSYYVILRSLNNLPSILSDTLRQWFEMVKHIE
ncbi:hypothetical protein DICPUDRAFT_154614 [Dictyostelium purpureum]|uniref:Midasin n=1 Tax=Dictyostelium purpureum TaxID=5786 RepID=F0ZRT1_DICPU|nr:uncharacterized protein DICPUDRAFT_154614 [Dictyostelium purpureum]EGC33347.1 hypothetical protein DICPUDRAFT_154614 [Dictyostelium purpureum]|eukprot:XP_003290132.1 hypothetical protein DICPUDRAFT_154614 [Dictyostelium purpureum]